MDSHREELKVPLVSEGLLEYLKVTFGTPVIHEKDNLEKLQREGGRQDVYLHFYALYEQQLEKGETL